jgi:hypothetical protein
MAGSASGGVCKLVQDKNVTTAAKETGDGLPAVSPRVEGRCVGWLNPHHTGGELTPLQRGRFLVGSRIGMRQAGGLGPMAE